VKRFLTTLSVLLAVALASTGCNVSSTPSVAGRVNASTISTAKLDDMLASLKSDSALLCLSGGGKAPMTTGAGTGTWNIEYAGFVLAQLIKFDALQQLVAAHHLYVPTTDLDAAKTEVESAIDAAAQTGCPGTPVTAVDDAGTLFRAALLDNQLNQDAYSAYLAGTSLQPASLASWERANTTSTSQSCTSVIQLTSHSLALKLEGAIRAGASFASEADRYSQSTGTAKGGAVGCILEQDWVGNLGPIVAGLRIGAVSRPVSYESGWLLFLVTKRVPEPVAGLLTLLEEHESASFDQQYGKALADAHVTVSPVYGTWRLVVSKAGIEVSIVPPSPAACSYALSAVASGCATTSTAAPTGSTSSG
jgi:hypothetical protein